MEARRRNLEILAVARCLEHASRVAAHSAGLSLHEAQFRIEIEVARHLGHAAEICGVLAVVLFGLFQPVALDGTDGA